MERCSSAMNAFLRSTSATSGARPWRSVVSRCCVGTRRGSAALRCVAATTCHASGAVDFSAAASPCSTPGDVCVACFPAVTAPMTAAGACARRCCH